MNERRKSKVVDKPSQTRMAVAISWPFAAALGVLALMLGIGGGEMAAQRAIDAPDDESIFITVLTTAGIAVVSVSFVAWMVFRETHRFAGPTYRMKTTIDQFLAGDTSARATLRKNDHLNDLAGALNTLLDRVELKASQESETDSQQDQNTQSPALAEANS